MSMYRSRQSEQGFSLIELMVVIAILTLVMGVVFRQIMTVQQRYRAEEAKLDIAQQSREFLDQMVRDLHQLGYPTQRMYSSAAGLATPAVNDQGLAAGLVKYTYNDLWFEGDLDGDGQVDVVRYTLNAPGGSCPCTVQRSQAVKLNNTAPLSQTATNYQTELQNVINSGGSGGPKTNGAYNISGTGPGGASNYTLYGALASPYIFQAFDKDGMAVSPADVSTAAGVTALASVRSIQITINVLAAQTASDLQTGRRAPISLTATARVMNY